MKSLIPLAALVLAACSTPAEPGVWARSCRLHMTSAPTVSGEGVVVRVLDRQAAMALLAQTETLMGAPIDRRYLDNVRAEIRTPEGRRVTVHIPAGMSVEIGDRVAYHGSYRSPEEPCSYVPNAVSGKL